MSLKGLVKKYTKPKRLFRLALLAFGVWGAITVYQSHKTQWQKTLTQYPSTNVLGEKVNDTVRNLEKQAENQIRRVLGQTTVSVDSQKLVNTAQDSLTESIKDTASSELKTESIVNMVKQDLKAFPQKEVKKVQLQICKEWLQEDISQATQSSQSNQESQE